MSARVAEVVEIVVAEIERRKVAAGVRGAVSAIALLDALYPGIELQESDAVGAGYLRLTGDSQCVSGMTSLREPHEANGGRGGPAGVLFVAGATPRERQRGALWALVAKVLRATGEDPIFSEAAYELPRDERKRTLHASYHFRDRVLLGACARLIRRGVVRRGGSSPRVEPLHFDRDAFERDLGEARARRELESNAAADDAAE